MDSLLAEDMLLEDDVDPDTDATPDSLARPDVLPTKLADTDTDGVEEADKDALLLLDSETEIE
jgi:hypothetical protein